MSEEYTVLLCGPCVNGQMWTNLTPGNLVLYSLENVVNGTVWYLWVLIYVRNLQKHYSCNFQIAPSHFQDCKPTCTGMKTLFVHIDSWRQIDHFEVVVKELSFSLVSGQKSQFFFLQKKVRGHDGLLGTEGGAWFSDSMADRCLQRPDSCDYKLGDGLLPLPPQIAPSLPWGTCGEYCPLLWQKQWPSLSAIFTLTRWPGCIVLGARAKCGPPLPPILSISTSMWRASLTATLSLPWDSSALCAGAGRSRVTSNLVQIVSKLLF